MLKHAFIHSSSNKIFIPNKKFNILIYCTTFVGDLEGSIKETINEYVWELSVHFTVKNRRLNILLFVVQFKLYRRNGSLNS